MHQYLASIELLSIPTRRPFHAASLGPTKYRYNVTFGEECLHNRWDCVSLVTDNIVQSQTLFSEGVTYPLIILELLFSYPSLIANYSKAEKNSLSLLDQTGSVNRQVYNTPNIAPLSLYFLLGRVCQTPSSVRSWKSHFPRRATFLTAKSWIASPLIR